MTAPVVDKAAARPAFGPLLALGLVVFVAMTGFGIVFPIMPFFGLHIGASATEITLAVGAYSFGQLIAAPAWGRLSDRFGRRPILIATLAATAVLYLALAAVETIWALAAVRFAAGLAAGNIGAAFAAAADLSTPQTRARAMGVLGASFGLGFIVGPAIGGLLAGDDPTHADFARVCFAAAALAGAASLVAVALLPETRPADLPPRPKGLLPFWRRPVLLQLVIVTLLTVTGQALMESTFGLWSHAALGWGPTQMGITFAVVGLLSATMQGAATGVLTRRFGEARLLIAGLFCYAAGFALLVGARDYFGTVAAMTVLALGAGVVNPAMQSLVSQQAGEDERGAVLGVQQSASALGRVIGPLVGGPALQFLGLSAPFLIGGVLAALALALAWAAVLRRA